MQWKIGARPGRTKVPQTNEQRQAYPIGPQSQNHGDSHIGPGGYMNACQIGQTQIDAAAISLTAAIQLASVNDTLRVRLLSRPRQSRHPTTTAKCRQSRHSRPAQDQGPGDNGQHTEGDSAIDVFFEGKPYQQGGNHLPRSITVMRRKLACGSNQTSATPVPRFRHIRFQRQTSAFPRQADSRCTND